MEKEEIERGLKKASQEAFQEEHEFFERNKDKYLSPEDVALADEISMRRFR